MQSHQTSVQAEQSNLKRGQIEPETSSKVILYPLPLEVSSLRIRYTYILFIWSGLCQKMIHSTYSKKSYLSTVCKKGFLIHINLSIGSVVSRMVKVSSLTTIIEAVAYFQGSNSIRTRPCFSPGLDGNLFHPKN